MACNARLDALGFGHLLELSDAELRDLGNACLEVAAVRSWQQCSGAEAVARSAHVDESARDLAREERSEEKDDREEDAAEIVEGKDELGALMLETAKKFPLRDLALQFKQFFVDHCDNHIGPWLDGVDIARLAMTCKWNCGRISSQNDLTERLYKQVCDRLDFKQTGTKSRPVPWVQIFVQHLCVECWQPAVSTGSVHVNLNGGSAWGGTYTSKEAVKRLCGDCRKIVAGLTTSELKSKGLPQTAQRFGDAVRRKILHSITAF